LSSSLQIFLLSRDRPDYLREALQSALAQSGERIEVIVSDNSEREEVARMLAASSLASVAYAAVRRWGLSIIFKPSSTQPPPTSW